MTANSSSLSSRTVSGLLWAYGALGGGRVLVLVTTSILARLLSPSDFGLVAIALVFLTLLDTVADLGLGAALVAEDDDHEFADKVQTAFVVGVGIGISLTLVMAAAGPGAAAFFDQPELVALMPALGLVFLLGALGTTHSALAQKRMDFRSRTAAEIANVAVRGVTGIGLALAGWGAWSLVLGYVAGTAAMTVVLWMLVPWRPALRVRLRHVGKLLRFGGPITAVTIIGAVIENIDDIFVGRVLGPAQLGLYTLAFRLPNLFILALAGVASEVLFPAFAALRGPALRDAFLAALKYTAMVTLPVAVGMASLAEPVIRAAFGDQWGESTPAMRVLVIYSLAVAIGVPGGTVYKAIGRADVLVKLAVPWALLAAAGIAAFVREGIVLVAASQAFAAAVVSVAGLVIASRLLQVSGAAIWRSLWPPLAAATGTAGALLVVEQAIAGAWTTVAAGAVVGAATYVALLWLLAKDDVRHLLALVLRR